LGILVLRLLFVFTNPTKKEYTIDISSLRKIGGKIGSCERS